MQVYILSVTSWQPSVAMETCLIPNRLAKTSSWLLWSLAHCMVIVWTEPLCSLLLPSPRTSRSRCMPLQQMHAWFWSRFLCVKREIFLLTFAWDFLCIIVGYLPKKIKHFEFSVLIWRCINQIAVKWQTCLRTLSRTLQSVVKPWKLQHKVHLQSRSCDFWNVSAAMLSCNFYFEGEQSPFMFFYCPNSS